MGWISPTGFVDGGGTWNSENLAYDENTGNYAYEDIGSIGYGNYIELTLGSAIDCDKVQIWSERSAANVDTIDVDVYYNTAWNNIYSGALTISIFVEYAIGSTESVTAVRIRYSTNKKSRQARICELDFNEVSAGPQYKKVAFASEPPTPNAWNQLNRDVGTGWKRIKYEGD